MERFRVMIPPDKCTKMNPATRHGFPTFTALVDYFSKDINQYIRFEHDSPITILGKLINNRSLVFLKQLLKHPHINVNKGVDKMNMPPFHYAIQATAVEIAEELLHHPTFQINKQYSREFHNTPLLCAIHSGHTYLVQQLLQIPTLDINYKNRKQETALSMAAAKGELEMVRSILLHPDLHPRLLRYALKQAAASDGSLEIVKVLVDGQTLDTIQHVNRSRRRALYHAYKRRQTSVIHYLEKYIQLQSKDIYYKQSYNQEWRRDFNPSLFQQLVEQNETELADYVLTRYIPPKKDSAMMKTVIQSAVKRGNVSMVRRLGVSLPLIDLHRSVHEALFNSYTQPLGVFVKYIRDPTINLNYMNHEGCPFLTIVAKNAPRDYMEHLLECKSLNLYVRDAQDRTPYQAAWVWSKDFRNVPLLKHAIKRQEKQEGIELTKLCLFGKYPLPNDVERIIYSFLKTDFSNVPPPYPKKKVVQRVRPPPVLILEADEEEVVEVEEEEEEEEEVVPFLPRRRIIQMEDPLHAEEVVDPAPVPTRG